MNMDRRSFLALAAEAAGAGAAFSVVSGAEGFAAEPSQEKQRQKEASEIQISWEQLETKMQQAAIMEKNEVFALHVFSSKGAVAIERGGNGRTVECMTTADDHFIRRQMGNVAEREKTSAAVTLSHTHPLELQDLTDAWHKASIRAKTAKHELSSFRPLDPPSLINRHGQGDALALFELHLAFGKVSNMETRFYVYGPSGERWEMKVTQPPHEIWKRFSEVFIRRKVLVSKLSEQANKSALDFWNALVKKKSSKGFWDAAEQFGRDAQDKFPELAGAASEAGRLWNNFYGDYILLFERAKSVADKLRAESAIGSSPSLAGVREAYGAVGLELELAMPAQHGLLSAKE